MKNEVVEFGVCSVDFLKNSFTGFYSKNKNCCETGSIIRHKNIRQIKICLNCRLSLFSFLFDIFFSIKKANL